MRISPLVFVVLTFQFPGFVMGGDRKAELTCWPQFRGPDGQGAGWHGLALPTVFSATQHVRWKTALPAGHSSPCVWGGDIFVTGFDKGSQKLETICLERKSGKVLWRRTAPSTKIEHSHQIGSPASSTPACDGQQVYVYFGSYGLLCYDMNGQAKWQRPLDSIPTAFGSGTSPVVADGLELLNSGEGRDQFVLLALDRRTGKTVWKKNRPRGMATGLWSTPLVRHVASRDEVIVPGGLQVSAYGVRDGALRWQVPGLPAVSMSTPALGEGLLFVTLTNPIGDPEQNVVKLPSFDELLKKYDKNHDGKLSADEIPADMTLFTRGRVDKIGDFGEVRQLVGYFDKNKDKALDRAEWQGMLAMMTMSLANLHIAVAAIRLDEKPSPHPQVVWQVSKSVPEVPSPLYYQGRLYLITERGILTCRDANTGKEVYSKRLGGRGACYSSPVVGDNKIYIATEGGVVVVLKPGDRFQRLAQNDIGERLMATPALVDDTIYLRTERHMYAFGE